MADPRAYPVFQDDRYDEEKKSFLKKLCQPWTNKKKFSTRAEVEQELKAEQETHSREDLSIFVDILNNCAEVAGLLKRNLGIDVEILSTNMPMQQITMQHGPGRTTYEVSKLLVKLEAKYRLPNTTYTVNISFSVDTLLDSTLDNLHQQLAAAQKFEYKEQVKTRFAYMLFMVYKYLLDSNYYDNFTDTGISVSITGIEYE